MKNKINEIMQRRLAALQAFDRCLGRTKTTRIMELIAKSIEVPKKASSTLQHAVQLRLSLTTRFLSKVKDFVNIGYYVRKGGRTGAVNLATSYIMKHAITGEYPDFKIAYPQVNLSNGSDFPGTVILKINNSGEGVCTWECDAFAWMSIDECEVLLLLYNESRSEVTRCEYAGALCKEKFKFRLTDFDKGEAYHAWIIWRVDVPQNKWSQGCSYVNIVRDFDETCQLFV